MTSSSFALSSAPFVCPFESQSESYSKPSSMWTTIALSLLFSPQALHHCPPVGAIENTVCKPPLGLSPGGTSPCMDLIKSLLFWVATRTRRRCLKAAMVTIIGSWLGAKVGSSPSGAMFCLVMCDEPGHTKFPFSCLAHATLLTLAQAQLSPCSEFAQVGYFCLCQVLLTSASSAPSDGENPAYDAITALRPSFP